MQRKPPLRPAEEILDGFVRATGGSAYRTLVSSVASGSILVTGQKQAGTVIFKSKAPDRFLMRMIFPELGAVATGYDGTVGWTHSPSTGLRLLRGEELAQLRLQALQANAPHRWRSLFRNVETVGVAPAGKDWLYKLRLWPKDNSATLVQFYDSRSLLLVRADHVQRTPQGPLSASTYYSNWHTSDALGIKSAFQVRQQTKTMELTLTLTRVQNNLPLPKSEFARPAETPSKPAKVG